MYFIYIFVLLLVGIFWGIGYWFISKLHKQNLDSLQEQHNDLIENFNQINAQAMASWGQLRSAQEKYLEQMLKFVTRLSEQVERRLEQIRDTVDEKLTDTLNKRLAEQFSMVSERLEQVYKQLGQMQELNKDVGDLKKILSGVKTRGVWGELQLEDILLNFFSPSQFVKNAKLTENAREAVEFALKLPKDVYARDFVFLPLDSKFPLDVYKALIDAVEKYDKKELEKAEKVFFRAIKLEAKRISKYINPPKTTAFAVMYLPSEGIYAQVAKNPELLADLYKEFKIMVAGPTTITAFLTSISMGLKTMAIQRHTDRVWDLLKMIKKDFQKFQLLLSKTSRSLELTKKHIDDALKRSGIIANKLEDVEVLPIPGSSGNQEI